MCLIPLVVPLSALSQHEEMVQSDSAPCWPQGDVASPLKGDV